MTVVILDEAKNLIVSVESTLEILRLPPQNDITTQSPVGEGEGEGSRYFPHLRLSLSRVGDCIVDFQNDAPITPHCFKKVTPFA